MMDVISLKNARFLCSIGILDDEKLNPQEIETDIDLHVSTKKSGTSDNISDGIDYAEVYDSVRGVVMARHYNLIESLAENIADELLNKFTISKITVRIRKRGALSVRDVEYASVEIVREKK